MKKILFFTHYLVAGGAEKTIVNLASYINEHYCDYETYIAIFFDDKETHGKLSNVHVLPHKMPQGISKIKKIPILFKQVQDLKGVKKQLEIDVCISFLPGSDFLNVLSKGKEKIIISVRNKESFFVKNIWKKLYIQYCYWKSDKIIAISERVKFDIINYFKVNEDKVRTIYNPTPHFTLSGKVSKEFEQLLEQKKKIIITAGRLTEQKGHEYLIRAFEKVLRIEKDAHLVILGKGELEGSLKLLSKELRIDNSITFEGFAKNPHDYIKKSDIFVFSSIVEGLGNVLVETLACETPIISTDCDGGPREILAPNTQWSYSTDKIEYGEYGILVPVCAENVMAEAMIILLEDENMRQKYKINSKNRLVDFEIGNIVQEWIEEIENCMSL